MFSYHILSLFSTTLYLPLKAKKTEDEFSAFLPTNSWGVTKEVTYTKLTNM